MYNMYMFISMRIDANDLPLSLSLFLSLSAHIYMYMYIYFILDMTMMAASFRFGGENRSCNAYRMIACAVYGSGFRLDSTLLYLASPYIFIGAIGAQSENPDNPTKHEVPVEHCTGDSCRSMTVTQRVEIAED